MLAAVIAVAIAVPVAAARATAADATSTSSTGRELEAVAGLAAGSSEAVLRELGSRQLQTEPECQGVRGLCKVPVR
jgi:hypothetical protein